MRLRIWETYPGPLPGGRFLILAVEKSEASETFSTDAPGPKLIDAPSRSRVHFSITGINVSSDKIPGIVSSACRKGQPSPFRHCPFAKKEHGTWARVSADGVSFAAASPEDAWAWENAHCSPLEQCPRRKNLQGSFVCSARGATWDVGLGSVVSWTKMHLSPARQKPWRWKRHMTAAFGEGATVRDLISS